MEQVRSSGTVHCQQASVTGFLATAQARFLSRQSCSCVSWGVVVKRLSECM